jgi:hypothetical protein
MEEEEGLTQRRGGKRGASLTKGRGVEDRHRGLRDGGRSGVADTRGGVGQAPGAEGQTPATPYGLMRRCRPT